MQSVRQYKFIGKIVRQKPSISKQRSGSDAESNHETRHSLSQYDSSIRDRTSQGDLSDIELAETRFPLALGASQTRLTTSREQHNAPTQSSTDPTEESEEKQPESKVVEFDDEKDLMNPHNWSPRRKVISTIILYCLVFVCGWASACDSPALDRASHQFHVSHIAESLATALYLFGVCVGSLLAGPISETIGRNITYLSTFLVYMIFLVGSALAPNFTAQVFFRFLAGFFASPSMSIFGGSLADMYSPSERAVVWPLFATASILGNSLWSPSAIFLIDELLGPVLAPVAGGWIVQSSLPWQWVYWVTLIMSGISFLLAFFFLPETFGPVILQWKASHLRTHTGNNNYATQKERDDGILQRYKGSFGRLIVFLTMEPITVLVGLYMTLLYVLVFSFLQGFTFIFSQTYGFKPGLTGTAFVAVAIGVLIDTTLSPIYLAQQRRAFHRAQAIDGPDARPPPEVRLLGSVIAAPFLPISLFWLGWTNYASVSPWSNLAAAALFGFALMGIFVSTYHYIIESYGTYSSNAMAAITFMRYSVAGAMVIATVPMYEALHVHWTMTLLGCVGTVLVPVPWAFWMYGDKIRKRSRYAEGSEL